MRIGFKVDNDRRYIKNTIYQIILSKRLVVLELLKIHSPITPDTRARNIILLALR